MNFYFYSCFVPHPIFVNCVSSQITFYTKHCVRLYSKDTILTLSIPIESIKTTSMKMLVQEYLKK